MKTKILYFTDPHNSATPPLMRTGSYCEDILKKQEQLVEPAKKCDLVVCGGDVFHQKKVSRISHALVNKIMEIYREFPRLYVVPGNHDIDTVMDWSDRPLGTLEKLPNIRVIHEEIVHFGGMNLYFFGGGDFFSPSQLLDFVKREPKHHGLKVGVLHYPIATNRELYKFEIMLVQDLLKYFQFMFLGHIHTLHHCDGLVAAPGALSRGVLAIDETLERQIWYTVVQFGEEGRLSNLPVELIVKSPDEIFKMEEKRDNVHQQRAIESFVNYIEKLKIPKGISKEQLLVFIDKQDVSEPVKREAKRILEGLE